MDDEKMKTRKLQKFFIVGQVTFVVIIIIGLLFMYPKAKLELKGNNVNFKTINANAIIISNNPDFSNPRIVDLEENVSFNLKPGTYYWKASNGILEGFSKDFTIDSEVGLEIVDNNEEKELLNVGNVRINVTKTKDGSFVGHLILEPEQSERIENEDYIGRQDDE